jgi:hypothetical protein
MVFRLIAETNRASFIADLDRGVTLTQDAVP